MGISSDLTTGKISRHLLRLAIPASIGSLFMTFYNLTDTYFAGQWSTAGLSALSLTFASYLLLMSLVVGLNSAGVAAIATAIGQKDNDLKNTLFAHLLWIAGGLTLFIYLVFPPLLPLFFKGQGASDASLELAISYMRIIIWGFPINVLGTICNGLLNAAGDTKSYRNMMIGSTILNIGLDPLFLFGGGFIPSMGIPGIALATVLAQFLGLIYLTIRVRQERVLEGLKSEHFRVQGRLIKEILQQGYPQAFNMILISGGIFVINSFLSLLGQDDALASYLIGVRIEQIALLPAMGLNVALLSIVGQNMGAKEYDRVREGFKVSLKMGFFVMIIMLLIILPAGKFWLSLFTDSPSVLAGGFLYLMVAGFTYYCYLLLFSCSSLLQGIKKPRSIAWIGLLRQIVAPFVVFSLVTKYTDWGILGIFISIGLINWTAALTILGITLYHLSHSLTQENSVK